ncbi:MAG: ATP-dependent metallopeptidase FtsH/Yme1/Tma family protein, partial [Akkermansiaceae bacterium]|nr:ATP-dependent metallopeptidase FtsH/Yme1/Tma family protein [Akkermansiaceae bacterium]
VLVMLVVLWIWQSTVTTLAMRTIPYSEFKQHLAQGEVVECSVEVDEVRGRIEPGKAKEGGEPAEEDEAGEESDESFLFRTVRIEDPDLVKELQAAGVKFTGVRPHPIGTLLLAWALPIGILIMIWIFVLRRAGRAAGSALSMGKSRARVVSEEGTGVDFSDVAGCDEAKFELQEVVEFLKEPDRFRKLGARIPKGVLLVGPPGTGKTLLARAVAGEAGVPFFSLSASDFVEMFVGVGAARVRDLFEQAKKNAPCIIFIDELDAIGRTRGVHMGAANDEREQTLNQLLVEMDGFDPNDGVIVMAATNRPDVLDPALLRPGRFDRQVVLDAPDAEGREAILIVHSRNKPLFKDVDLKRIARATAGFSGADLANVLNEAALLAARREGKAIRQQDLEEAIEKVVAGPTRKSRRLGEEEKRRVAYHEAGHALVAAYSEGADPVHKISIVPRGRAALGYTMQLPVEEQYLSTRAELLGRIRGMLAGRAAEQVVFGEVTTGASSDLDHATALARQMVCHFGMSDKVGLASVARREQFLVPGQEGPMQRDCSEETARLVDEEVKELLDQAYEEAIKVLESHRDQLEAVVSALLESETLDGNTFYEIIGLPLPEPPLS